MKTTLNINDELMQRAKELSGINEKTSVVNKALQILIEVESQKRLLKLAGTERNIKKVRRRRP